MSGRRVIGFPRRITTPDRVATGPAAGFLTEEQKMSPARFSVPQAGKSRSSHHRMPRAPRFSSGPEPS